MAQDVQQRDPQGRIPLSISIQKRTDLESNPSTTDKTIRIQEVVWFVVFVEFVEKLSLLDHSLEFYESCSGLQKKKSLKFVHFVLSIEQFHPIIVCRRFWKFKEEKNYKQSQILMISFYDFLQESKLFDFGIFYNFYL